MFRGASRKVRLPETTRVAVRGGINRNSGGGSGVDRRLRGEVRTVAVVPVFGSRARLSPDQCVEYSYKHCPFTVRIRSGVSVAAQLDGSVCACPAEEWRLTGAPWRYTVTALIPLNQEFVL